MKRVLLIILVSLQCAILYCSNSYAHQADKTAAVILSYSRINQSYFPDENIENAQFILHMETLKDNNFHIKSIGGIVDSYYNDKDLPEKTTAITFDGGYKSILKVAVPYLIKNETPFTIFFDPQKADENSADFLNWDDLKLLSQYPFVTLGILPFSFSKLTESNETRLKTELNLTKIAFREHLGREPEFFAYPYGEYNLDILNMVKQHGYKAAFGLQSGVAYSGDSLFALPRFAMTEKNGDLSHFLTITNALPLPVINKEPQDPYLKTQVPVIGFTLDPELQADISMLSCFVNGVEKADIETVGTSRVEIRLKSLFQLKTRVNCTLPVIKENKDDDEDEQWRWIGFLLTRSQSEDTLQPSTDQTGVLP